MGKRNKYLEKKARDHIIEQMHDNGEMSKEELKDLIRPHFNFDYQTAKEQAIGRYANGLVSSLRDEQGVRTSFTLRNQDLVVNVDRSKNLRNVRAVKEQLRKQIVGTYASYQKTEKRESELMGQISIFDVKPTEEAFDFSAPFSSRL